jgi:hypothetical protein
MPRLPVAQPKTAVPARQGSSLDNDTATVPVLLDRVAQKTQRNQVRAILQNRPEGDRVLDEDTGQRDEMSQVLTQTGPDIIETV